MARDMERLFDATSWSPSFTMGITAATFHAVGNVHVVREQLIMFARGPCIMGRQSLRIREFILSIWSGGFVQWQR